MVVTADTTDRYRTREATIEYIKSLIFRWVVLEDDEEYKLFAEDLEAIQCFCRK